MSLGLGPAVDGEVFWRCDCLEVIGIGALQAADEGGSDLSSEEWVFTVGLLTAAPSRVAIDIDIGRPEGEAVEDGMIALALRLVIFGTRFGGNGIGHLMDEAGVPRGRQSDGLRKNRCIAGARDSMQTFVPPVIRRDMQARDGGRVVLHLRDFFLERHASDEVVYALSYGESRVQVGIGGGGRLRMQRQHEAK